MINYHAQIQSVFVNDIRIGFIARRSIIIGCTQEIPDGWMCTKNIVKPEWFGNFPKRKEARKAIEALCGALPDTIRTHEYYNQLKQWGK